MMRQWTNTIIVALLLIITPKLMAQKDWRSGWCNIKDQKTCDKMVKAAKELKFDALITNGSVKVIKMFSDTASKNGIESYLWLVPVSPKGKKRQLFLQKLRPEAEKIYQVLKKDPQKMEKGYQGGGEPLPGHVEYNWSPAPCCHYDEVMQATKDRIKQYVESCPNLTGIALDMFGYQNYRDCVCEASEKKYAIWRKHHPKLDEKTARNTFFFETLINSQNELCRYARSLKKDIKTTVHVWPVYLPKPLYGNHLDLDYCAQTAAWYFKPYWNDEKIKSYTKTIVEEANKYHPRQTGIPFVGLFVGQENNGDKSLQRFIHEVSTIFKSSQSRSLSVFSFNHLVDNPEYFKAFKKLLESNNQLKQKGE